MAFSPKLDCFINKQNVFLIKQNDPSFWVSAQSGRYLCHVDNGIGQALHQIVNLTVKGKKLGCFQIIHFLRKIKKIWVVSIVLNILLCL